MKKQFDKRYKTLPISKQGNNYNWVLAALWLASALMFAACQQAQGPKVLKLAHGLDIAHPVHQGMLYMAHRLDSLSGGELTMRVYPSGQLGAERECLELLQIGSLDMTKVSAAVMENFAPSYEVLSMPYIFESREHNYRVLDGPVGKQLLSEGERFRLRGLCFYDAGSRSFYTKNNPVHKPEDLEKLKIRVQKSKTAVDMVTKLGGSPTPIAWGELYTALQQGVVDGAENNTPSFVSSKHYEVCKYFILNEHTMVPDVLVVSDNTWKKLDEEERGWLEAAANASVHEQRRLWQTSEKECMEIIKEAGVNIITPDKQPFIEKINAMYARYEGQPEKMALIKKIRKNTSKP